MALEARASSSSQSSIKPAHRGRMIKDVTARTNSLEPLGRGPQPPVGRRGSGCSDISADGSALNKPDALKRRVHELEKENNKLRLNLDEAAVAMNTYRNLLAAKSRTSNVSTSTQTELPADSRGQRDPDAVLRTENAALRAQITSLQHDLSNSAAQLQASVKLRADAEKATAATINDLLAQIKALTETKAPSAVSTGEASRHLMCELQRKTRATAKQHTALQEAIAEDFSAFTKQMRYTIDVVLSEVSRCESRRRGAATPTPHRQTTTPLKGTPKTQSQLQMPLNGLSVEAACSPMTPVASRHLTDRSTDPLSPAYARGRAEVAAALEEAHKAKDATIEQMMHSLKAATDKYESEKLLLEAQAHRDADTASALAEKLAAASREFQNVLMRFGKEINAVKHLSHCKDLVRIAAMRELGLEKDRLANEVKYSK